MVANVLLIRSANSTLTIGQQTAEPTVLGLGIVFRISVRDSKSPRRRTARGHQGCATLHRPPVGLPSGSRSPSSHPGDTPAVDRRGRDAVLQPDFVTEIGSGDRPHSPSAERLCARGRWSVPNLLLIRCAKSTCRRR
jgi:hypothetical protein